MNEEENVQGEFSEEPLRSPIPQIGNSGLPKDDILVMLEEIETYVEKMRRRAFQIEEERDAMFTTLHTLKHSRIMEDLSDTDRDDIDRHVERIYSRCSTIDISIKTIRDKPQEDALHRINGIIDNLITQLQHDPTATRARCLSFMNSCAEYCDNGSEDKDFEQELLRCTLDDQNRVRRRLQGLMNYIEKLSLP